MSNLQTAAVSFAKPQRRDRLQTLESSGLTARLAIDPETKADAYGLRYLSYLSGGYIDPTPSGLFQDADDEKPNCQSVVIYKHARPVASVRLCVLDSDDHRGYTEIPANRIFPEDVEALLASVATPDRPSKATEINRLVRHPDFATDVELVFVLFRFVSFMVLREGSDMMLSCVRRNHTPFYKRLNFQNVAGPRKYAGVKFETNLMACPQQDYTANLQNFPIVDSRALETGAYDGLFHGETVNVFGSK
ncbi:MAG: hypothetical protein B7Y73_06470 [Acidocella sp. 35-58-6]|jgi:hypothetical protein|nr:MAG: hypothetical protein B7Z77_05990 [Acidocella sp. 20-58-15]OYY03564.1 MAG: hypothetical protein B7Y73_06470 [Acidocella sp. 35-58-6]